MTLQPLEHRQYAHCESGVVTALLKRHGLDLSEPMVFGITGGLTFACLPFLKITGMPIISYRMFPGAIIKGAVKHLDARFRTKRYWDQGRGPCRTHRPRRQRGNASACRHRSTGSPISRPRCVSSSTPTI